MVVRVKDLFPPGDQTETAVAGKKTQVSDYSGRRRVPFERFNELVLPFNDLYCFFRVVGLCEGRHLGLNDASMKNSTGVSKVLFLCLRLERTAVRAARSAKKEEDSKQNSEVHFVACSRLFGQAPALP